MSITLRIIQDQRSDTERALLGIAGAMVGLFGVGLSIAGSFAQSDGSFFYMMAGFGLVASGALLAKRHPIGAWTYLAVFAVTLFWALDNGQSGSPLAYRLLGPVVLLVMISILMPILARWSRIRSGSVCAALIVATLIIGISASDASNPSDQVAIAHSQHPQANGVLQ